MLRQKTVEDFCLILSSDAPAPGGGSVSALNGAMAASLVAMVAELSLKRPELEGCFPGYREILADALELKSRLGALIDRDSEAFFEVMDAFKLPKGTDDEKKARSAAIQQGYKTAAGVPLETAALSLRTARLGERMVDLGFNTNAASDLGVGLECARTGFLGAMMNVSINLGSIKDAGYLDDIRHQMARMASEITAILDKCTGKLAAQLS
ncbi:MAG: cyclodeaminase/cyclohydrolase family protein [Deltaproteobacteria bacterium]|jgi:formiminotetrahydrofolate cyclodeaminase|nr:cyclodeaminase/cyclohydrolase family protein [Deltaproteobacteria bacterium]